MAPTLKNIYMEECERRAQIRFLQRPSAAVVLSLAVVLMVLGSGVYVLAFYLE